MRNRKKKSTMKLSMEKLGLVLCVISSILLMSSATRIEGMVGGRTKISDVKMNKEVQDLGKFCVEEFNKVLRKSNEGELIFTKVVEAETQIVSGVKYYMKIEIKRGSENKIFDSVVVVKPWIHSRQLVAFNPTSAIHFKNL